MKGKYKDGIKAEQWFQYFENGQPWTISPIYHEGKRNGKYIEYYENGDVLAEASFKDDKKNGKLIHYSETGEITLKGNFIMGDGKLVMKFGNPIANLLETFLAFPRQFLNIRLRVLHHLSSS